MTQSLSFCLDLNKLNDLAENQWKSYAEAEPFPHIVIDNFLPESVLDEILEEFPKPGQINWRQFDAEAEKKLASTSELQMGEATRFLLYQLNSSVFLKFLEKLTGISGIIPDPYFHGGGLHQIEKGGFLKMHVDFNKHKGLGLDRRLNLLIYLNKNWQEEYGGHFEMWDAEMTHCFKKVLPIFNRCVIFSTSDFSYHGHPDPLTCPEGMTRKSLALYYYTNGRPPEEVSDTHSTVFQARPGDNLNSKPAPVPLKTLLKKFLPPILFDLRNAIKHKS
ncbi:2OG-Fe(II) oxygenase [Planktothrix mougeotii]|uniref:2OG-Fe(II) oxygenase n=1 Tax=Planktothrix mougeotii LEGE 06226 TaxID=1828728 RepID=A0ABR9UEF9_9CYAN|nr:2OG-Fe(II) oxygenase [Planktothrix mougeotii]MBE9144849.1 2OG-Fe(II) oxygenase [Planktothrix mougeotii LEGE 06226]